MNVLASCSVTLTSLSIVANMGPKTTTLQVIPTSDNQIKTTSVSVQPQINSTDGNNTITG